MRSYKVLSNQLFVKENYKIVPIRDEDKRSIMKWRNEQIYHLRQEKPLTEEDQDRYFSTIIPSLFDNPKPAQILFSFLKDEICIGYGGLVHINWIDRNSEVSFVMDTSLESSQFDENWSAFLSLLEETAFGDLQFHKLFTYAYDLRPQLYKVLEKNAYNREAVLQDHCFFDGRFIDVIIHSKIKSKDFQLRPVKSADVKILFDWANDPEVRENSFNSVKITWENHCKWFDTKLNDKNIRMFILYSGNSPAGQIRFDKEGDLWNINYSIAENHRGKGLGNLIVQFALDKFDSTAKFKAKVKTENTPSLKVFVRNGFVVNEQDDKIITFIKSEG